MTTTTSDYHKVLLDVFGYHNFRGNQENIINSITHGNDTLVVMPTGAGKSLCYQLPALLLEGTTIVISPLIALMKNQVDQLKANDIKAAYLNSSLTKRDAKQVRNDTMSGELKLLYVAPESLTKAENIAFLKKSKLTFVAVDEAHCISEWGHDFRPEYRKIKEIIQEIGKLPIIALTATATPKVELDIVKNLGLENAKLFKGSFNRSNLYYDVRPKKRIKKQLIALVQEMRGKSGIVYCLSRKKVEEIAEFLQVNKIKAAPYHAGMDSQARAKNQDDFLNENIDVIVATIAFGMGIDKPDVRFVIHYDTPKSLESYYQETGRAGRDGLDSKCVMFYSPNDIVKLEKFNKDKPVTERDNARILLDEMTGYSESSICRRKLILHYFGEKYPKGNEGDTNCCDNCDTDNIKFDGTDFLKIALNTIQKLKEKFSIYHLQEVIQGIETASVLAYEHHLSPLFGQGKHIDKKILGETRATVFWRSIIRQGVILDFLYKEVDSVMIPKLTDKGKAFLKDPYPIIFFKPIDYNNLGEEEEIERTVVDTKGYDKLLYSMLIKLRKKIAAEKGLPPYLIFLEPAMEEMATTYPITSEELGQVSGVGIGKVTKYGSAFTSLIKKYVEENDIPRMDQVLVKSKGNKSRNKIEIIKQVDRQTDFEGIAESLKMSFDKLLEEMELICFSGTKLNIQYYVDHLLDEESQEDINDYFLSVESDNLEDALDEFEEEFSEEEIRIMRIHFLSQYAN